MKARLAKKVLRDLAVMRLEPGDVVVLRVSELHMSGERREAIRKAASELLSRKR